MTSCTFQSTLSMRRATVEYLDGTINPPFQSTLSMRRATGNTAGNVRLIKFQSTLSMRRATRLKQFRSLTAAQFQSTLSMRRATGHVAVVGDLDRISIHALHEESDRRMRSHGCSGLHISIHALHEESDMLRIMVSHAITFQSTLSMRRATNSHSPRTATCTRFQSTLSMRRATYFLTGVQLLRTISIHALHEESDHWRSARAQALQISIHALHEESDLG